ncbi:MULTISPECIES: carbon-nitrogen hydrolase [Alteromonadaceae]|uniref:carbon-nitrogen hydrolase n=1 Tax=Alteromonadaceae TaxID=72275 RepID=UPI001C089462|nr:MULTISPECIES: carbon-nitrogen hydrolase [Aliiglaciecola]MBU2879513.1 carbon-nitrogen hydrolase [Aliiglaciecola lipolytica]MDO6712566.1 carbon-nitrogen hydrolase [Aliiglaciecola sp. 2_MG-2023]MDO6753690.1 carbon-nitrogen hydrolase [Aliiglaciecola sp. 1_MG-2023]
MNKNKLKVGLVQQAVASNDKNQNWEKSAKQVAKLAADGCELVLLQELHSTLYFCQEENTDYFDLAETIPGPATDYFAELAAKHNIVLVTSLFEKRGSGLYHNTAVVFDRQAGMVGKYRKMHIPDDPGFYEKFYFTPGDLGFEPIDTSVGRLGVLVCWDQWYPEAARLMAMAGADMLFYPTAIGWDNTDTADERERQFNAWQTIQRSHAVANSVPVIVANRTGFEASPVAGDPGIQFWGQSFITGPQGEVLAQASSDKEETLMVELDLARTEKVKRIWPYFRDRRIDEYQDITRRWRD